MADLPGYVVLMTRSMSGELLTHLPTAARVVGRFRPDRKGARYVEALELRDCHRRAGRWAIVVDERDLWLYEPNT